MLGDVGLKMLDFMAFGGSVPGAIQAGDVPVALKNLQQALSKMPEQVEAAGDAGEDQPAVSLPTRAVSLLALLQAAIAEETYVRWD